MTFSEIDPRTVRVTLTGRLDAPGADRVGLQFSAAGSGAGRRMLVDMRGVDFIASLGIRLLISTARSRAAAGGQLVLFGATEMVQQVFDDAALDQIITIVPTEAEALTALGD